jgi:hypothetical protein
MSSYFNEENPNTTANSRNPLYILHNCFQIINDKIHFYKYQRWAVVACLALCFLIRLIITKGKQIINIRLSRSCIYTWNTFTKLVYRFHITSRRP